MSLARTESSVLSKLHPRQCSAPRDGITEFVALESVPCVGIANVRDFLPVGRDERFVMPLRITRNRLRQAGFKTELDRQVALSRRNWDKRHGSPPNAFDGRKSAS